jgi:hypothetical protein
VPKHGLAIAFDMLVEPDAGAGLGHDRCERGLADLKRIAPPQIVAVQFDQVEGVEERAVIMAAVANEIERRNAVVIAGDRLTIDDAGVGPWEEGSSRLAANGCNGSNIQNRPKGVDPGHVARGTYATPRTSILWPTLSATGAAWFL